MQVCLRKIGVVGWGRILVLCIAMVLPCFGNAQENDPSSENDVLKQQGGDPQPRSEQSPADENPSTDTPGELPADATGETPTVSPDAAVTQKTEVVEIQPVTISDASEPTPIRVPPALMTRSRFEPSGLVWLPDIERFFMCSPVTGLQNDLPNAPMVFFMEPSFRVEALPVRLNGIPRLVQVEAAARGENGKLYLVASQRAKNGNGGPASEFLLSVQRNERELTVIEHAPLASMMREAFNDEALQGFGFENSRRKKIEVAFEVGGLAMQEGGLILGLRSPYVKEGALLWKLNEPDTVLKEKAISPGQLEPYGTAAFDVVEKKTPGIAGLAVDDQGTLYAVTGRDDLPLKRNMGALYRLSRFMEGSLQPTKIREFPAMQPETITFLPDGRYLILLTAENGQVMAVTGSPDEIMVAPEEDTK